MTDPMTGVETDLVTVVRAVRKSDLDGVMYLASQAGDGMTTLKPDRKLLGDRINVACASFGGQLPPEHRDYLFVMENISQDTGAGKIIGVSAIKSSVGLDEPFYNYRIGTIVHSSKELGVYSRMDTLYLSSDLTGCTELCSLFLHPDYRTGNNGRLLSKFRFLFIAQFPHLFNQKLIAELRGFQRPDGTSPFWDNLGRHFFQMDFDKADDLSSRGKKSFIAELMPRHPLYVAYLPKEAQEAIGKVHVDTAPARHLLEQEGLHYEGFVDIFDAGPVLQARVNELRSTRLSKVVQVDNADDKAVTLLNEPMLVANTELNDYRVILSYLAPEHERMPLTSAQQQILNCAPHSPVRVMPLYQKK